VGDVQNRRQAEAMAGGERVGRGMRISRPSLRVREGSEGGGILRRAGQGLRNIGGKIKATMSPRASTPRGGAVGKSQTKRK
jgi:hypothetical protein